MSFEQPNPNEALDSVKKQFTVISEELLKRKDEGQNFMFGEKSEEELINICQRLESGEEDTEAIAKDFEKEIREFGKHVGHTIIDNLTSIMAMSEAFTGLSDSLKAFNPDDPHIARMSELSRSVSDTLEEKSKILDRYLNRQ